MSPTSGHTTVRGLIQRDRMLSRWELVAVALTAVALVVAGLSLARLWPPRSLPHTAQAGIQAQ